MNAETMTAVGFSEREILARLNAPAGDVNRLTEYGARRLREMRDLGLSAAQWDRRAAQILIEAAKTRAAQ
jgi:hypothetical protein